ncbi:uncharacterized protein cubi_00236 [Cryptosporidium ubiquitum]|uniref:Uncharacterized protein n=1 Tax=Cryptosporidium ubiquitum TaxID=857276 RepID=A0A1J4MMK1_9CRYT|nr:uncharacterized protein cubi_00236 [Cryptosporidium ubiquitum]OII74683.1 hypothetical protein cubi_00236 [Cryptosporidium ubiquitum]
MNSCSAKSLFCVSKVSMVNPFAEEMREDDMFLFNNTLIHNRSNESSQGILIDKIENEKVQLLSCDAYWDCTDIRFTADAVFAVAKLSCDFIDKIVSTKIYYDQPHYIIKMLCAIKLSNSKNMGQKLTFDSILSVLENDDRKHKRAQDVIRSYRRHHELLFAFEDREYIKHSNRDAIRN